ncbi:DUF2785 domain-containing protein [Oceanobacillus neutriphilus]|uniref:Membrane protein n=1 Tax=Oceanobacillus neutriphilus TaxID=531815 RepID=A0ABQ2NZL0_9BACI|nr:DUF2785 domain-containing protein [Oceanobacillus neutriphilus]GGP14526.1 membrane protein [Oceanobacillus neutriphilus]
MTLKVELQGIDYDTKWKQKDLNALIEKMLDNIGTTDAELRDALIFNTFGKLILEDCLTNKQMEYILDVCLHKLFLGIEEKESDLVFTRSCSALVIGIILHKDRQKRFLQDGAAVKTIKQSIEYLNLEEDTRGYVEGKGWAHSIAHGADLLTEAIKHPCFDNRLSFECLETMKRCLFKEGTTKSPYIDEEEERLLFVLEALIDKGIKDKEITFLILDITDKLQELKTKEGDNLNFYWKKSNAVNFLRGLYFRLLYKNTYPEIRKNIAAILEQWHRETYNLHE